MTPPGRVVIAGGSGFLGQNLARHLVQSHYEVVIGAPLLLRTDPELALYGRYCVSRRLREEGFEFSFPDLPSALRNLYR